MRQLHSSSKKRPHFSGKPGKTSPRQRCFWLSLIGVFSLILLPNLAKPSDVVEVIPLTNQIIMVHFDDGYVDYHDLGERREDDVLYHIPLNVALADQLASYTIRSADDPAYASGVVPDDLSRKSKGTAYLWLCESYQDGVGCTNTSDDHAKEHWVYLFLPEPMQTGKTYTVDLGSLAKNGSSFSLTYDDNSSRTEAVHVNNVGYDPAGNAKYGYVYHWMGTRGGLDLSSYAGASFQLINQATGNADFTGTLAFRKAADNQESPYTDQTPDGNFLGAEVYECNFSGFGGTGTYVLSVDGIGCSFPFELNSNVYDEVFYWTMKGLYQNRSGIALEAPYTDQPRPAPHNPNITPGFSGQLKYTSFRYPDATKSDNDKSDKPLWEAGIKGDINTWGWYQDAGDWDAYSTHARVPANLLFLYEVAPQNFNDGQLNIPESGNGLPDLLDEARWLIRFYHRTRQAILDAGYGTGGVGGARVFGDLWGGDELADGTTIGSWQDTERLYVVSGEDPFMTYTYAGLAAQYAWILEQGGFADPEGINWRQEAQEAWTWAKNNTLPGDETPRFSGDLDLLNHRMYAAAALYRLTGGAEYHTQLISDVASKALTTTTVLDKDNRYPAWIYSLMDNRSKDPGTADLLRGAVQYTADFNMLYHVDKRACRWAGNYFFPMLVGQGTTPMVNDGVMGYAIASKLGTDTGKLAAYKLFLQTTCDYFLGTNPLNMTWLTGVGDRSPGEIFHLDSWYSGQETPRKGIIPYGPWHDELSLGPVGPWNHKWANKTLTPSNVKQWPGHERWYDLRSSPFNGEFTIHQNNGVAAMVYGFLKNGPGTYRGGDNNPPVVTAPSNLSATATAADQVNLSWQDNGSNEVGFRVERKTGNGAYAQIATVPANATAYVDNGLTAATTYTYRVRAYDASSNSAYSNEASVTTQANASSDVTVAVSRSSDDAEEAANTTVDLSSDDLDFRANNLSAVRFALDIPQGASVSSATVSLVAKGNTAGANTLTFSIELASDAATFSSSSANLSGRTTTGSVSWSPGGWTDGETYTSPDLSDLIQTVVNRSDWAPGNHVAIWVNATASNSGKRAARTYDYNGSSSQAPQLSVSYSEPDNDGTTTPPGSDGLITLEAEDYTNQAAGSGTFSNATWDLFSDGEASEGQYMKVSDNNNQNAGNSLNGPRLDYAINVSEGGAYYLWIRVIAPTPGDDSCIPALDGSSRGVWHTGTSNIWTWKQYALGDVSAGSRTLSLHMREDGLSVDKLILTNDADYVPDASARLASGGKLTGEPLFDDVVSGLKVYPNPSSGLVQVQIAESSILQVHNSVGQLVYEQTVSAGRSSLNLSSLGTGVHLISTTVQGQRQVERLVLE